MPAASGPARQAASPSAGAGRFADSTLVRVQAQDSGRPNRPRATGAGRQPSIARNRRRRPMASPISLREPAWLQEFKAFIMRGSVVDLAVGLVIGAAFTTIVTSL